MKTTSFLVLIILTFCFSTISFAAPPYLGVSNSSKIWNATINYSTQSEPQGNLTVRPGTASGIPGWEHGENVKFNYILFTNKNGGALPFEDWCSTISHKKFYSWIDIKITEKKNRIHVTCDAFETH